MRGRKRTIIKAPKMIKADQVWATTIWLTVKPCCAHRASETKGGASHKSQNHGHEPAGCGLGILGAYRA